MEQCERGSSLIEYALVVALIAITAGAGLVVVGSGTSSAFTTVSEEMQADVAASDEDSEDNEALAEWEQAQADYEAAIGAAKAERDAALAAAEEARTVGKDATDGLPKGPRTAAEAQVDAAYAQAKTAASRGYEQATGAARDAKNEAEAAYLAATGGS